MNTNILWFIVFVLVTIAIYVAMTSMSPAHAEFLAELWKGYEISPDAKDAIKNARSPDGADCCGTADGQPVEFEFKGDHYEAFWDGAWRPIPPRRVVKHLKNVSFSLIWLTKSHVQKQNEDGTYTDLGYRDVNCFWPGAGG